MWSEVTSFFLTWFTLAKTWGFRYREKGRCFRGADTLADQARVKELVVKNRLRGPLGP